ncbi:MAG: 2-hydroxyglutaryl-CoA dehydratase [Chloroflexi bacterium RBG_13_51_52]|nr:MAG: 2-hydroxyglutaryl-CoA dehydratase [Chloroflexi bacterium RBG_13_51_52]
MEAYLGIDVGSITVKFAVLNAVDDLLESLYLPAAGKPVDVVQQGLGQIGRRLSPDIDIKGVAATGSARYLAGAIVGADLVKNEITCQAVAAVKAVPDARTVIEIGGQDSKLIIIRDGMVEDFAMNTVCAAGTGSFLDHQAGRLRMSIEEFSRRSLAGKDKVNISGRCTVFAESDMVHKQQMGYKVDDIIFGLCRTLARNYLSDVGSGKDIQPPVVFQGGVAFNKGIIRALHEELKTEIIVPPHHEVMGAIGAALLAHEAAAQRHSDCRFRGFDISEVEFSTSSFECHSCPTTCEIVRISEQDNVIVSWGGRCDMWETATPGIRENN